jgi:hypothetical protein
MLHVRRSCQTAFGHGNVLLNVLDELLLALVIEFGANESQNQKVEMVTIEIRSEVVNDVDLLRTTVSNLYSSKLATHHAPDCVLIEGIPANAHYHGIDIGSRIQTLCPLFSNGCGWKINSGPAKVDAAVQVGASANLKAFKRDVCCCYPKL